MLPNPYIIHLESCTEREIIQTELEAFFQVKIPFFHAISAIKDSNLLWKSPQGYKPLRPGELGCVESHYILYKENMHKDFLTVFEDDAEVIDMNGLGEFLNTIPNDFDILLLGYNQIVKGTVLQHYKTVTEFWGTHAMILSKKSRDLFINEYDYLKSIGQMQPADWLWNSIIQNNSLTVYTPLKPSIVQKEGLLSAITGGIRTKNKFI